MEAKYSRWLESIIRKEGEKVDFGTATEFADLQTEERACKGIYWATSADNFCL